MYENVRILALAEKKIKDDDDSAIKKHFLFSNCLPHFGNISILATNNDDFKSIGMTILWIWTNNIYLWNSAKSHHRIQRRIQTPYESLRCLAIYNWNFIHRHPSQLGFCRQYRRVLLGYNTRIRNFWYLVSYIFCFSFCLLFYLDGMFEVEKYKLLLRPLVKNNMHQTNTYFCDDSYGPFIFKSKSRKNTSFLGTLRFYNKSFAIWWDSKGRKQIWKSSV